MLIKRKIYIWSKYTFQYEQKLRELCVILLIVQVPIIYVMLTSYIENIGPNPIYTGI